MARIPLLTKVTHVPNLEADICNTMLNSEEFHDGESFLFLHVFGQYEISVLITNRYTKLTLHSADHGTFTEHSELYKKRLAISDEP